MICLWGRSKHNSVGVARRYSEVRSCSANSVGVSGLSKKMADDCSMIGKMCEAVSNQLCGRIALSFGKVGGASWPGPLLLDASCVVRLSLCLLALLLPPARNKL